MPGSLAAYDTATNRFVTGPGAFDNAYDMAGNQTRNKLGELLAYDANNRQTMDVPLRPTLARVSGEIWFLIGIVYLAAKTRCFRTKPTPMEFIEH